MPKPIDKAAKSPNRTVLKQPTLAEAIFVKIRDRLQRGEIGANDRLLDYEIAEEFECTRMTVRQALLRLANEGYLTGTTRGFVLPTLTADDVREIFEVRRMLEPGAAANAALALTDRHDDALKRAYQKIKKASDKGDGSAMIDATIEFRDAWLDAVQNSRLRTTIRRFADHARQVRLKTLTDPASQQIATEGLKALLDGFIKRDVAQVKATMTEFIFKAEQQYFKLLYADENHPDFTPTHSGLA